MNSQAQAVGAWRPQSRNGEEAEWGRKRFNDFLKARFGRGRFGPVV
jgi:hypothetical protein